MKMATWGWRAVLVGMVLLTLGAAVTAAERTSLAGRPARRPVLLQLEQDISALTTAAPADAVAYGGAQDVALLRQIAAATRASAQAQLECIRQQDEIVRLLEIVAHGRKEAQ
jgi:hypothetical protein